MRALLAVLLLAGCLHDSLEPCGDQLCPETAVCRFDACVPRDALAACGAAADGSPCTTFLHPDGVCIGGICSERRCGNGVVDPGEVCDGERCDTDCGAILGCPPFGMTPLFGASIELGLAQPCQSFTTDSTGHQAAQCASGTGYPIEYGTVGGSLDPVPGIDSLYNSPLLSPEGDELWAIHGTSSFDLARLRRDANGAWVPDSTIMTFQPNLYPSVGVPSRGPERHFISSEFDTTQSMAVMHEMVVGTSGTALPIAAYTLNDLHTAGTQKVHMGEDGLHITYLGQIVGAAGIYYADRASLSDRFGNERLVLDSSNSSYFMSGDCSRLYFPILNDEYYVRQIAWR